MDTPPGAHPLPWLVRWPDGRTHRVRGEFVVGYAGADTRWLPSSTHATREAAEAAAFPLTKADGGTIARQVFQAEPVQAEPDIEEGTTRVD